MIQWPEALSAESRRDMENVGSMALEMAEGLIKKHGKFAPFAIVMGLDGKTHTAAASPAFEMADHQQNVTPDVIAALRKGLQADRDGLRAVAVATDVWIAGNDAVRIELENPQGLPVSIVRYYKRSKVTRKTSFSELSGEPSERRVWVDVE